MRSAALALLLIGCASTPDRPREVVSPAPPSDPPMFARCQPPVLPPKTPPRISTVERVGVYANAEAEARHETAMRLWRCRKTMDEAIEFIESNR